jgi:16S rRNA (guanine(527)-N(7))-methyltransferase RsmG
MTDWIESLPDGKGSLLKKYVQVLMEFNKRINLISRKINHSDLNRLLSESLEVERQITNSFVVDAGSGNGLLGIPVAIMDESRLVQLAETNRKKADFLYAACEVVGLKNVRVHHGQVELFLRTRPNTETTVVARGFPEIEKLQKYLMQRMMGELILITAPEKCRKNRKGMETVRQKIYNIPFRNNLVICKMEYVSRET